MSMNKLDVKVRNLLWFRVKRNLIRCSTMRDIARERRKKHIRKRLVGTTDKPRVYVFKSNRKIYVGVADDSKMAVLASINTSRSINSAEKMGKKFAGILKKKSVSKVCFDRSGYKFHGVVAVVADGLKSGGIEI